MGQNCQLGLNDDSGAGQWWRVSEGNPYIPPRTGSAGVYLSSTGSLYMFGGKNGDPLIFKESFVSSPYAVNVAAIFIDDR